MPSDRLDAVQTRFLKDIGVDSVTSLISFHLAPLSVRRDIAMLGLIHRTALGTGPPQFSKFFSRESQQSTALLDPRKTCNAPLIRRSALGLVSIYNMLPPKTIAQKSVSAFQKSLQSIVIKYAESGCPVWLNLLSPRLPLSSHPLTRLPTVAPDLC